MKAPRLALLAGLFLVGLSLRPQLVGVGPLLPRIRSGLDVSHAVAGLLGTIPVLCMGLFAPSAPHLSKRIGSRAAVAGAVSLIAVFGIARALVPGALGVVLLTVPVGIGMGLAGALMPVAVKEQFSHRPAFATGIYATGINGSAAISSAVAVPLAHAAWGWRGALLIFSLFTALLPPLWLASTRQRPPHVRTDVRPVRLPWHSPLAWRLVAVFFLMSTSYYGVNAWLPDAFQEHGWSESSAGNLLAVVNGGQLTSVLLIPWLADRYGSRRFYLTAFSGVVVVGMVGVILAPGGGWVWAALIGVGFGALFPMTMTLPLDVANGPAEVGAVTGMMLGVGYTLGSVAPFALGAMRDATGSFRDALWLLVGSASLQLLMNAALSRERLGRGVPSRGSAPVV